MPHDKNDDENGKSLNGKSYLSSPRQLVCKFGAKLEETCYENITDSY